VHLRIFMHLADEIALPSYSTLVIEDAMSLQERSFVARLYCISTIRGRKHSIAIYLKTR